MIKFSGIQGGDELAAILRELPEQLSKNALAAAARAGAVELQGAALASLALAMRRRAPREGDVIIKKARGKKGEDVQATYLVGPPRRKPWLRWLHDGTKPHDITPKRKKVLFDVLGGKFFGAEVTHPGQKSHPWLKSAQFSSQEKVLKAMAEKIRTAIPKQANRLVSQKYRNQLLSKLIR